MQISVWDSVAWGCVAVAGGLALNGIEVVGFVEYLLAQEKGFSYLVSGGATVTALAALVPLLAGKVRRAGHPWWALTAWCALPLALAVTLLAAIERTGTTRDTAVQKIEAHNLKIGEAKEAVRDAKEAWRTANADVRTECKSGDGAKCKSLKTLRDENAETLRKARAAHSQLVNARLIDSQARRIAALFPWISETQVQLYQPIILPMTIAVLSILFVALGDRLIAAGWKAPQLRHELVKSEAIATTQLVEVVNPEPVEAAEAVQIVPPTKPQPQPRLPDRLKALAIANKQPTGAILDFLHAGLEFTSGPRLEMTQAFIGYFVLCKESGQRPMDVVEFVDDMEKACDQFGIRIEVEGDRYYLVNVRLAARALSLTAT